jgi:hypothetical protein
MIRLLKPGCKVSTAENGEITLRMTMGSQMRLLQSV